MPAATTRANPDELRARYRAARRMPQLLECRDAVRLALRQVSDEMDESDGGNGNAELQALFAQLKALLDEIDTRITRQATIDDLERRAAGTPLGSGDAQWSRAQCEFSITKAIAHAVGPALVGHVDAGRETEISQELARRSGITPKGILVPLAALSVPIRHATPAQLRQLERRDVVSTTTPAAGPGGALIATLLEPGQYVDVLRPAIGVRALGARVLSNLTSNIDLPKMTKAASAQWFAENSNIADTDQEFATVPLRPRHCGAITEISRNMLQQSTPDVESIVRNDLAQVLARAVDTAAIQGAGTTVEPLGILNDENCTFLTGGTTSPAPTYDMMVQLTSALAQNNALEGSLGWLADSVVRGALLTVKDGIDRPYGLDVMFQGFPHRFSNLAAGIPGKQHPVIFGNWADLVIGMWSELDILVNPYESPAFRKGNVSIRAAMTIDVCKRHAESFAYIAATEAPSGGGTDVGGGAP